MLHSYFIDVILSPRFKLEYFCATFVLYWCCFVSSIQAGVLLCYFRTLLMLFCLLDLSWSTFVLHSYFTGVVLSPRFKLEYFCVTFVLY